MAEGVFLSLTKNNPRISTIDSCGTGAYHTLEPPDYRTMDKLKEHNITDYDHGARRITSDDLNEFDYVFAMDRSNLQGIQRIQRDRQRRGEPAKAKVMLFGEFSGKRKAEEVDDPYYGRDDGFEDVYQQVKRFSENFLKELVDKDESVNGHGA